MHRLIATTLAVTAVFLSAPAQAQERTEIELDNAFVRAFHNRVTMEVQFRVVGAQTKAHSAAKDGEVHMSGLARLVDLGRDLGFATVAEILHARQYEGPGQLLQWIAGESQADRPIRMTGVWRLWSEHGSGAFKQGNIIPPPGQWSPKTNPNHTFELHPLTQVVREGQAVNFLNDFQFLPGFTDTYDLARTRGAFGYFERITCRITPGQATTKISSTAHKYNFVGFVADIKEPPVVTPSGDGLLARADIYDQSGAGTGNNQPLARDVRLVFVGGTPPAAAARTRGGTGQNSRIPLVGFPRVNLTRVATAIETGQVYNGKLPYEIVITWLGSNP